MHDDISQVLLLNALSSSPHGRIIDVLHLRNLYETESGHVVVQRFSFRNGQTHLMDDGIDLGVILDLIYFLQTYEISPVCR